MRGELDPLMAYLTGAERDRLTAAFGADPELADGLSTMLDDLPPATQGRIMRRLAAHLERTPLGAGAVRSALADVIEDTLRESPRASAMTGQRHVRSGSPAGRRSPPPLLLVQRGGERRFEPPAGDCRFRSGAAASTCAPAARPFRAFRLHPVHVRPSRV